MEKLKESVKCLLAASSDDARLKYISEILNALDDEDSDRSVAAECAVDGHVLTALMSVISGSDKHDERCLEKAVQLVAELAKTASSRGPCVAEGLVAPLVDLLDTTQPAVSIQACRALGNICFDNDSGRDMVCSHNGTQRLIQLMKTVVNSDGSLHPRLRLVSCGCLLNLTNTHGVKLSSCNVQRAYNVYKMQPASPTGPENLRMISLGLDLDMTPSQESVQEQAVACGALKVLKDYLNSHRNDESLAHMVLMCVDSLADSDHGREKIQESALAETIADLLGTDVGRELQDQILELLASLAESDGIKLQLAKSSLPKRLLEISETCNEPECNSTEKLAADLVVLILTGDGSMEVLYDSGQGIIYQETVSWLMSRKHHLQAAGALAMGNFARSDIHCIQLVHEGVAEKLLLLLERTKFEPLEETEVTGGLGRTATLQHAVLSALRNLAIPAANKPVLVQSRLVERVLPCVDTDVSPVQFKLLATLRMLVDGQEDVIKTLAANEQFLSQLVTSCTAEDHAGVKGEACRLFAWMVKHCHATEVMESVVRSGAVVHLIKMASSEHAVMQNEALVAIALLLSSCQEAVSVDDAKDLLIPTLKKLLDDSSTQLEIVHNVLTAAKVAAEKESLKPLMLDTEMKESIQPFQSSDDKNIKVAAKAFLDSLGKG